MGWSPPKTHTSGGGRFLPPSVVPYVGVGYGNMPPAHSPPGLTLMPRQQHAGATYTADSPDTGDAASSSNADQTNTTVTSTDTSALGSLLGGLSGLFGGSPPPPTDGTTTPGAVVNAASNVTQNQAAPDTNYTVGPASPGGGTAPATPGAPGTAITPAAPAKSHLLWWIVGGVAAAGVILLAWRMFGHKGAIVATSSAAKAAAFYGMR